MAEIRELLEYVARGDATRQSIPDDLRDAFAQAEVHGWVVDAAAPHSGHGNQDQAGTMITRVILTDAGQAELARHRS
jgi:hypothetical protein